MSKNPRFDWIIYADATFAGLSLLIPIPLLDVIFEHLFRRRMPSVIGRRNGRYLPKETIKELNRLPASCLNTCLGWPLLILFTFLKRLYRTILYFLTIKDASDSLSFYWHRAFLLNYATLQEHLDEPTLVPIAAETIQQILETTTTSPLTQLSRQVVGSVRHIFATLRRVLRRGEEDDVVAETRDKMANLWADYDDYFAELATQYDALYDELLSSRQVKAVASEITILPQKAPQNFPSDSFINGAISSSEEE